MLPKGVDPEKWGLPTWVVMHALAYLASVGRMDVAVVRGAFRDMRLLLPCKKCRVGLAEIVRAVPPPDDADALLAWVNEAHNAVNRKKRRAEVEMDDGLGGRIASMGAEERRAYVLVATVRAASYMHKCIAEREQYEQYRREMPAIRAAWSRFALVAKSMPVALRATRRMSSFGAVRVAESVADCGAVRARRLSSCARFVVGGFLACRRHASQGHERYSGRHSLIVLVLHHRH